MKIGVIGSGAISDIYLDNMINRFENLEVLAVASRNPEHSRAKAEKFGIMFCTVEELLANPDIEMVVNLTPASVHATLIRQALLAGKHVYTEKAMTDDVTKSRELLELAEEKGLYLGSAPDTFLGSALQTARDAIDSDMLGEIQSFAISANRCNDILLSLFSFLRQPGGGILYDYGVYYLTALTSLLGSVSRVGSIVRTPYPTHKGMIPGFPGYGEILDTPNESQVAAILQLENGITGTLQINADSIMADQAFFAIYGKKGILYLTDPNTFGGTVKFLPNSRDPRNPQPAVALWNFTPYGENSRGIGPSDMADAIEKGIVNRASKEMAYHVQEVLTAILEGCERGGFTDIVSRMTRPDPLTQKKLPITGLAHVSFQMKHVEEMLHFYRDVLGMQELFTLTLGDLPAPYAASVPDKSLPWITYLKMADRRYVELFYPMARAYREIADRRANYGYFKFNFEVRSIREIHDILIAEGIRMKEEIHPTADGAIELTVLDPDGNEVQFTEYTKDAKLPLSANTNRTVSAVEVVTQVAYQVKDAYNMANFYCKGLGLRKAMTLTYADLAEAMQKSAAQMRAIPIENRDEATRTNLEELEKRVQGLRRLGNTPWIDYLEVAPHQYIELFYTPGQKKEELRDLTGTIGYQHICLEVEDIRQAWDACIANGLTPDTEISLGADGAYQFWLVDPDGNRLELMEYTENARQLEK